MKTIQVSSTIFLSSFFLALGACGTNVKDLLPSEANAAIEKTSSVTLESKSNSKVKGYLGFTERKDGVLIQGIVEGLAPNSTHGIHLHQIGNCSAPDASSAGDHFDPDALPHGDISTPTSGTEAGDLGNITANESGRATVDILARKLTLKDGQFAINGKAIVVHAQADDMTTQPSGNSGARLSCGVIMGTSIK